MNDVPRHAAILGLGFGDCGKGLFVDFLCRHWQARTVVRFNGGAQAGHNVVLPDGPHHTFAQFGAGTFVPGVRTVLASPVVVHPSALLVENRFLQRAGVSDALSRLVIDARCRINTPYHQAAGRLREILRGQEAHGSCGVGVGETVRDALAHPDAVLRYADLAVPALARERLAHIRQRLRAGVDPAGAMLPCDLRVQTELAVLDDEGIAATWLAGIAPLLQAVPPASRDLVAGCLRDPGPVLFEGAQGALLDEWHGFHPHTTWSTTLSAGVEAVMQDAGLAGPVMRLGVLRSYLTRHGAGPLPTHDPALDCLAEPHNASDGWQGVFRRGHPDAVLLRHACALNGRLDGLLLSHLDVFARGQSLRWCEAYAMPQTLERLPVASAPDLAHQERLTATLLRAKPVYAPESITSAAACMARLSAEAGCPVAFGAHGNTHAHVFLAGANPA